MIGLVSGVAVAFNAPTARVGRPQLATASARFASAPAMGLYEDYQAERLAELAVPEQDVQAGVPQAGAPVKDMPQPVPVGAPAAVMQEAPLLAKPMRRTAEPPLLEVISDAADLLSHQAIMENFVHHNPWEALQDIDFFDALDLVEEKGKYMSPGERVSSLAPLDPRTRANKALAELGAPFLDRGLAKWEAPNREKGFLYFYASLEDLGYAPWRAHARQAAVGILDRLKRFPEQDLDDFAAEVLRENLAAMETDPELWVETTRAMALDLPGWGGTRARLQPRPNSPPTAAPPCRDNVHAPCAPMRPPQCPCNPVCPCTPVCSSGHPAPVPPCACATLRLHHPAPVPACARASLRLFHPAPVPPCAFVTLRLCRARYVQAHGGAPRRGTRQLHGRRVPGHPRAALRVPCRQVHPRPLLNRAAGRHVVGSHV